MIFFDFDFSRGRGNLREFFAPEWKGVLQSDGYDAYDRFLRERPHIIHAGCMAHLRRYVVEALEAELKLEIVARLLGDIALVISQGRSWVVEPESLALYCLPSRWIQYVAIITTCGNHRQNLRRKLLTSRSRRVNIVRTALRRSRVPQKPHRL